MISRGFAARAIERPAPTMIASATIGLGQALFKRIKLSSISSRKFRQVTR
jgi:hypothetical protein